MIVLTIKELAHLLNLYYEIGVKNTLRASIYLYNTKEEIDKLVELLTKVLEILRYFFYV